MRLGQAYANRLRDNSSKTVVSDLSNSTSSNPTHSPPPSTKPSLKGNDGTISSTTSAPRSVSTSPISIPSILEYIKRKGETPQKLVFSLAKLIEFYKNGTPNDDENVMEFMKNSSAIMLFSFTVSEEVLSELRMVMGRSMHMYIDQKMNSLDILEAFT